jgi:hypothetical protein
VTRVELVARVSDILRRSNVDDCDYLIGLIEQHLDREGYSEACGLTRASFPDGYPCMLPPGHEGYHRDENGRSWMVVRSNSDEE